MTILIKSAKIIDSLSSFNNQVKDILIIDGVIEKIEDYINNNSKYKIINLENLHVSPGWFDTSVSFGEPGYEEREVIENGLKTASNSGFTSVAVNPNTLPIVDNKSAVEFLKNKSINNVTDLYPIGSLTKNSKGIELAELFDMKKSGAIAFGDYNLPIENDNLMKIALQYAQDFNGLILSFPKNLKISNNGIANEGINATKLGLKGIPSLAEELQIVRDLFLIEYTKGKIHIPTISTKKSVELIREAKSKGLNISCSVAIHNLILNDNELFEFNSNCKVTPPLRTKKDQISLLKGVKDGTIDIITSDHNPIDIENKKVEFSTAKNGTIGLESAFGSLNNVLDIQTIVKCISENPKKIFGIKQNNIKTKNKACLTFFNPSKEYNFTEFDILSSSKNSIFLNKKLNGIVYGIYNNEQLIIN